MGKPRIGDVVEVRWVDSEHIALGWERSSEYRHAAGRPSSYRTAGYWIGSIRGRTVIALSLDPASRHVTHAMSIPDVAITETQVLGRANKRVRKAIR